VLGWDEAFLGVTTDDPEAFAADLRAAVLDNTRLHCSVGIGDNKTRAKLATTFAKQPRSHATPFEDAGTTEVRHREVDGVYRLTGANWREVMDHRAVRELWGIGSRMERNLNELGIFTVADLAAADVDVLRKRFGPNMGAWYAALGRGLGDTQVTDVPREPVSRSREETFPEDLVERAEVEEQLRRIAVEVTRDVVAEGRSIQRIWVKVRFVSFYTPIKSRKLPEITQDPEVIAATALALLEKFELRRPIRLLGVRLEFASPQDSL
jgi:DNA polymerase-4